jgi:hypothetical protein
MYGGGEVVTMLLKGGHNIVIDEVKADGMAVMI